MAYSADEYEGRAGECVTLANGTRDPLIQMELLKLRQTYLKIAQRLRSGPPTAPITPPHPV
jgi:hypothetical protein